MAKERKLSDIDRLYEELFGSIPAKAGTAYEMITAIVLAALAWQEGSGFCSLVDRRLPHAPVGRARRLGRVRG
jgi:hypothetical protein